MASHAFHTIEQIAAGASHPALERRASFQLMRYWEDLRGGRALPVEDDIDPDNDVLHNMWGQCFIVQVRDFEKLDFNYTYLGPDIIDSYREDNLDADQEKIVSLSATKLMSVYLQMLETQRPVVHMGEYTNSAGKIVKFRQCLLPFGKNKVDVILGHMTYKIYP